MSVRHLPIFSDAPVAQGEMRHHPATLLVKKGGANAMRHTLFTVSRRWRSGAPLADKNGGNGHGR
jgi:hypothetical protein